MSVKVRPPFVETEYPEMLIGAAVHLHVAGRAAFGAADAAAVRRRHSRLSKPSGVPSRNDVPAMSKVLLEPERRSINGGRRC
jgi:hypothetical protein